METLMTEEQIRYSTDKQLKVFLDDLDIWMLNNYFHYQAQYYEYIRKKVEAELKSRKEITND